MVLAIEIVSIVFMLSIMFIGIWGFVLMIKMYNQLKYRNYILEKLSQNVYMLTTRIAGDDKSIKLMEEDNNTLEENFKQILPNVSNFKK